MITYRGFIIIIILLSGFLPGSLFRRSRDFRFVPDTIVFMNTTSIAVEWAERAEESGLYWLLFDVLLNHFSQQSPTNDVIPSFIVVR